MPTSNDTNRIEDRPSTEALLEEYKEAIGLMRHDDQIAWTILGLTSTLSFAVWAYGFKDVPFWSRRALLLALLGSVVFVFGRALIYPITKRTQSRKDRGRVIEAELGLRLLTDQPAHRWGLNALLNLATGVVILAAILYAIVFVWR